MESISNEGDSELLNFFQSYSEICDRTAKQYHLLSASEREDLFPNTYFGFYYNKINQNYKNSISGYFSYINTIMDDAMRCSGDLKFATVNLYIFKPYVTNPVSQAIFHNGKYICRNFPSWQTYKYDFYMSVCEEKIYNFWDRIGDLIYFSLKLDRDIEYKKLYFGTVIDFLSSRAIYDDNEHFAWLKSFKNNEYKILNESRKTVVHYHQKATEYHVLWQSRVDDVDFQQQLYEDKIAKVDYYAHHLLLQSVGFQNLCLFLEFATNKDQQF